MTATIAEQEQEQELLAAAQGGDERAYERLIEPRRRELHAHCYRMLGSLHDADDALQDVLLSAWRGLPRFAGRSSLRTWLHTIAHNACLAVIERRPRRALPVDIGPATDPDDTGGWAAVEGWIEPYPDEFSAGLAAPAARYERRESVELAFVAAIQHLPPNQRAVLLMRDVLAFSAKETATVLDATIASVTSALQRARSTVAERLPGQSQQVSLRALDDARVRRLVDAYVEAWERGDAEAILALLAEDATFSMPPYALWFRGRADIAKFLPAGPLLEDWRLVPATAGGQLAFGCYRWDADAGCHVGHSIDVLSVDRDGRVAAITAFLDADLLPRFRLPTTLAHPRR
jgi:RNA polymerase sigma-70 factor, ECF subfamily